MIDYGLAALVLALAGTAAGLARAYLAHRTRLAIEREASARTAARMTGLIGLIGTRHEVVRFVEHDRDGDREVELGGFGSAAIDDREDAA